MKISNAILIVGLGLIGAIAGYSIDRSRDAKENAPTRRQVEIDSARAFLEHNPAAKAACAKGDCRFETADGYMNIEEMVESAK